MGKTLSFFGQEPFWSYWTTIYIILQMLWSQVHFHITFTTFPFPPISHDLYPFCSSPECYEPGPNRARAVPWVKKSTWPSSIFIRGIGAETASGGYFLLGHGLRCWWKNKWKKQHLDIILAQHDVKMYPACFEVVQVTLSHIQVTKNPKCPQCTSSGLLSLQKWRVKHGSFSRASLLSFQMMNPS